MEATTSQPATPTTSENTLTAPVEKPSVLSTIKRTERGIQLATFDEAYRFSKAVHISGLAPKGFDSPEKIFVAIEAGAEIGLPPMQALQSIAVINGRPSLWGDALPGLVYASGKCDYIEECFAGGDGENKTAICKVKRKGSDNIVMRSFSVKQARAAGLLDKAGPWRSYPDRMLQVRARAWAIRDAFADVLCGFQCAEEQLDTPAVYEERRVIEHTNDANYCALVETLSGKCGCKNDNDTSYAIGKVSRDFGSLADIKDNEQACADVLKALEGRHEEIAAELKERRQAG